MFCHDVFFNHYDSVQSFSFKSELGSKVVAVSVVAGGSRCKHNANLTCQAKILNLHSQMFKPENQPFLC